MLGKPYLPAPAPIATVATLRPGPAAILFRPGFVDFEGAPSHFGAVQSGDGLVGFAAVCHLDESETSRLARIPVRDELDARHGSIGREERPERLFLSKTAAEINYGGTRTSRFLAVSRSPCLRAF
jgi:hypothetical protein